LWLVGGEPVPLARDAVRHASSLPEARAVTSAVTPATTDAPGRDAPLLGLRDASVGFGEEIEDGHERPFSAGRR
jgi:hypothetical protein